jgi:ABC-type glycerol-3-phosphate transport system permease component
MTTPRRTGVSVAKYTVIALFTVWCIAPILWLLTTSLKPELLAFRSPPDWFFRPILSNFTQVWQDGSIGNGFIHSALVAVGSSILGCLLALPITYLITQVWDPSSKAAARVTTLCLGTLITPPIVALFPIYLGFVHLHILGSLLGLTVVYTLFNLGLAVLLLRSFLIGIPREIREAALVDGAGEFQVLRRVLLPLLSGSLIAVGILCLIQSWNEFLFALVLTSSSSQTLPVAITSFLSFEGTNWGPLSASGILGMLPIVVFALIVQKKLARGLTLGAVK